MGWGLSVVILLSAVLGFENALRSTKNYNIITDGWVLSAVLGFKKALRSTTICMLKVLFVVEH
jgi:hypothetical protein